MDTKTNHFKIGLFILSTITFLVAGVIALSAGMLKRNILWFETYIDESVQGLGVGSPVMQRGVKIGTVKKITFVTRQYKMTYGSPEFDRYSKYVLLLMEVDRDNFSGIANDRVEDVVKQWVANGLRVKIAYQGITGIAYVEADFVDPARYKPMEISWEPQTIYIPAIPSTLTSFTQSVDKILQTLNRVDFEGLSLSFNNTLKTIDQAVQDAQFPQLRKDFSALLSDLRQTNSMVMDLMDKSRGTDSAANIPDTIAQLNRTLKRMDTFISTHEADIDEFISNLRRASFNLSEFSEDIKQYPRQIIFGAQPEQSETAK